MSGVVKDDSKTSSDADTDGAETIDTTSTETDAGAKSPETAIDAETDSSARKAGPTLRLVADNEVSETDVVSTDAEGDAPDVLDVIEGEAVEVDASETVPPILPPVEKPVHDPLFPPEATSAPSQPSAPMGGESQMRIGAVIRAQRENLGFSYAQVSENLRLHESVLKAIEEMNPAALGSRVYALGHIRDYARYLKLDPVDTLARYKSECAILADPVKKDIEPPPATKSVSLAAPLAGLAVVALAGVGLYFFFQNSGEVSGPGAAVSESADVAPVEAVASVAGTSVTTPASVEPPLRVVALKRARIEFRGADGTKFLARYFSAGESYAPRVGAGWTVSATDGAAFEWRMGDMSLGLLAPEGGPVYSNGVDTALEREATPIVEPEPETVAVVDVPAPVVTETVTPPPAAARPRAERPAPARSRPAAPQPTAPAEPAPEEIDPSLLAYPQ